MTSNLTVRAIPKFPARVAAGIGMAITKLNGIWTFAFSGDSIPPQVISDPANTGVIVEMPDGSLGMVPVAEVVGSSLITAAGSDMPRSLEDRFADTINVKDFGAIGDGIADDTAAIQAAIVRFKAVIGAATGTASSGAVLYFPGGRYRITDTLNLTGLVAYTWTVSGYGATLEAATAGKPVLDIMGSRFGTLLGLRVTGDPTTPPSIGLQRGRLTALQQTGEFNMHSVKFDGLYTRACMYILAAEVCEYIKCSFWNDSTSATAYCLIMDGSNNENITSAFVTVSITPGTAMSFNDSLFTNADFRKGTGGSTILYEGVQFSRHHFLASYGVSYAANIFEFRGVNFVNDLNIEMHIELGTGPGTLQNAIWIDNDTAFDNIQFRNFRFSDYAPQFLNSCIALKGTGANKPVLFTNSELYLGRKLAASTAAVFAGVTDPTRLLFVGSIYSDWANTHDLHTENVIVCGDIYLGDPSSLQTFGKGSYFTRRLQGTADWYKTNHKGNLRIFATSDDVGNLLNAANYIELAGTDGTAGSHPSIRGGSFSGAVVPVAFATPFHPPIYTVATLPSAATYLACLIFVSDGTANKKLAYSDGTNWRFPDGAIVS